MAEKQQDRDTQLRLFSNSNLQESTPWRVVCCCFDTVEKEKQRERERVCVCVCVGACRSWVQMENEQQASKQTSKHKSRVTRTKRQCEDTASQVQCFADVSRIHTEQEVLCDSLFSFVLSLLLGLVEWLQADGRRLALCRPNAVSPRSPTSPASTGRRRPPASQA